MLVGVDVVTNNIFHLLSFQIIMLSVMLVLMTALFSIKSLKSR